VRWRKGKTGVAEKRRDKEMYNRLKDRYSNDADRIRRLIIKQIRIRGFLLVRNASPILGG
jgi:hypothetical protein